MFLPSVTAQINILLLGLQKLLIYIDSLEIRRDQFDICTLYKI